MRLPFVRAVYMLCASAMQSGPECHLHTKELNCLVSFHYHGDGDDIAKNQLL
jgi:hypothetical protein